MSRYMAYTAVLVMMLLPSTTKSQAPVDFSLEHTFQYDEALDVLSKHYENPKAVKKLPIGLLIGDEADRDSKIKAAVDALKDRWTHYYPPSDMLAVYDGTKVGSGLTVLQSASGEFVADHIMLNSGADLAGIRRLDTLVSIDKKMLKGLSSDDVHALLRGKPGSSVEVVYSRAGSKVTTSVAFAVQEPLVSMKLLQGEVAYLRIRDFSGNNIQEEFAAQYALLHKTTGGKLTGLILDMRGNPGGYMRSAYELLSTFIESGVVGIFTNREGEHIVRANSKFVEKLRGAGVRRAQAEQMQLELYQIPMVVLVNESTMSAAEATTVTLKERNRAKVVGEVTWGKGVHFTQHLLSNGGVLQVVGGHFTGPYGLEHHNSGIIPHYATPDVRSDGHDKVLEVGLAKLLGQPEPPPQSNVPVLLVGATAFCFFMSITLGLILLARRLNRKSQSSSESEPRATPYNDDGTIDWAAIIGQANREADDLPDADDEVDDTLIEFDLVSEPIEDSALLVAWWQLPADHFYVGAQCSGCPVVLQPGDRVAEIFRRDDHRFYCCECGAPYAHEHTGSELATAHLD